MSPGTHPNVAMLGLGRMGAALGACFAEAGVPLAVWNRSPAKARRFEGSAMLAPSAASACAFAELVVVCLSNYSDGIEVLEDAAGTTSLEGKVLVQITSGTSSDARMMQAWSRAHGLACLDAAILGYPGVVGTREAMVLVAGEEALFERFRATLALLGQTHHAGEAIGAAAALDCALLDYYYGATAALFHGAAVCASEGVPLPDYFAAAKSIGALLAATIDTGRAMIDRENYAGDGCTLDTHVGAMRHIQRTSHDNELDTKLPDTVGGLLRRAAAAGHGDEEIAAIFELLRAPSR